MLQKGSSMPADCTKASVSIGWDVTQVLEGPLALLTPHCEPVDDLALLLPCFPYHHTQKILSIYRSRFLRLCTWCFHVN